MNQFYLENKYLLSFLLLDFNRPFELQEVIKSIKKHVKFNPQIIVNSNGGKQDYVIDLYNQKHIHKLILNREGNGAGYGSSELFRYCNTDFAFYIESDQVFVRDFTIEDLNAFKDKVTYDPQCKIVNPVGRATNGEFTQRAFFCNTLWYNDIIKDAENGGPGPYKNRNTNENFLQNYLKNNNLTQYIEDQPLVVDLGCYSVNESPDGSKWVHRTDSKQLWLLKGPVVEKYVYPNNFSENEWKQLLETQVWPDGQIPENDRNSSFVHWRFHPDFEKNYIEYLRKSFNE